jgi:hypothetical protein
MRRAEVPGNFRTAPERFVASMQNDAGRSPDIGLF